MINKVFGTGGIGSGMFFNLEGNQSLGRDESRLGYLTDFKDYCKQHIILHYVAKLTKNANIYAIGKVGHDEQGKSLIAKMQSADILTDYVEMTEQARTMLSICFQYPDGSGGNITTSNSACNLVTKEYIEVCSQLMDSNSLVLAAPEVPLECRIRLMEIGRARGAFNVASILSGEVHEFEKLKGYGLCDLLAINIDEAKAISKTAGNAEEIAKAAYDKISSNNDNIKLIVTAGKHGAYTFEKLNGEKLNRERINIIDVTVVSTAGAGDALLGGTIAGIINGLPFQKGRTDSYFGETPLCSAVELGTIVSTFAVMSKDTIAESVTSENIKNFIQENNFSIMEEFKNGI